jgi:hypothetical protein
MSGKVVWLRLAKIARNATSRHGRTLRSCISYCGLSSSSVVGGSRLPQGNIVVNPGLKSDRDHRRRLTAHGSQKE